jgi:hypothetical protein
VSLNSVQLPTSLTLVCPTNRGGLGANGWYKTVVRRYLKRMSFITSGNIRMERELNGMVRPS